MHYATKFTKLYLLYNPFRLSVSEIVNYLKVLCCDNQITYPHPNFYNQWSQKGIVKRNDIMLVFNLGNNFYLNIKTY